MENDLLGNGAAKSPLDVAAFLDSDVPKRIAILVDLGVLVSIGSTRDGGRISLTVLHDGKWTREYFGSSEDAADWLGGAADTLRARGLTPRTGELPSKPLASRRRQKAF